MMVDFYVFIFAICIYNVNNSLAIFNNNNDCYARYRHQSDHYAWKRTWHRQHFTRERMDCSDFEGAFQGKFFSILWGIVNSEDLRYQP